MISKIKSFLEKVTPPSLFKLILKIYRHSFAAFVSSCRNFFITIFFRKKTTITIKNSDLKIVVDPKNGYTDKMLFLFKERDTELIEYMKEKLSPGDTVIDIGANIGYETIWAAKIVGKTGKVYSYEPLPNLCAQIQESIKENSFTNTIVKNKAAGNIKGELTLYIHPKDAGLTSAKRQSELLVKTSLVKLDDDLEKIEKLNFIKIDVEGYEYEALTGATKLLEIHHPKIIFEFTPELYEQDRRGKSEELLSFLFSKNYKMKIMGRNSIDQNGIKDLITQTIKEKTFLNIIAE